MFLLCHPQLIHNDCKITIPYTQYQTTPYGATQYLATPPSIPGHSICSNSRYNHPQNHVCSIRSSPIHFRSIRLSPIHFRAPLCGHEEECLPHTINETSNQSFEMYQTERIHREKSSERRGQIWSSTKTCWDMPFYSIMNVVNHPTTILPCVFQSMILV